MGKMCGWGITVVESPFLKHPYGEEGRKKQEKTTLGTRVPIKLLEWELFQGGTDGRKTPFPGKEKLQGGGFGVGLTQAKRPQTVKKMGKGEAKIGRMRKNPSVGSSSARRTSHQNPRKRRALPGKKETRQKGPAVGRDGCQMPKQKKNRGRRRNCRSKGESSITSCSFKPIVEKN